MRFYLSPQEFEDRWVETEDRCVVWLASRGSKLVIVLSALILAILLDVLGRHLDSHPMSVVTWYHREALLLLPLLALGGWYIARFSTAAQRIFHFFSASLIWIYSFLGISPTVAVGSTKILLFLIGPFFLLTAWTYVRYRRLLPRLSSLILSVVLSGSIVLIGRYGNFEVIKLLWSMNFTSLFIYMFVLIYREKHGVDSQSLILNPFHGMRGILWPYSTRVLGDDDQERRKLWWRGQLNFLVALALFGVRYLIEDAFYIGYVLGDIAYFNIVAGSARLFGIAVPDATRFCLLARTPAEFWRRGSVYNYAFITEFIFFPLLRRFRYPVLVLLIAFSFFFISHFSYSLLVLILGSAGALPQGAQPGPWMTVFSLSLFLMWFVAIAISGRMWPIRLRQGSSHAREWLSVFLTQGLFVLILYVATLISASMTV